MKQEKQNNKEQNQEKGCPLCNISEGTIERLKKADNKKITEEKRI